MQCQAAVVNFENRPTLVKVMNECYSGTVVESPCTYSQHINNCMQTYIAMALKQN